MNRWKEGYFRTFDGLKLFYRYKKPKRKTSKTLLFLHRGHEHSGRIVSFADRISEDDYWCFAFDLRGHGRSEGTRAWARNFEVWVKDLNSFAGYINNNFGISSKDSILVANSVGSVIAVSWILNYGPSLKGCILGAPAFSIKLYIPFALSFLRLARIFSDNLFVTSYVRSSLLTRDKAEAKKYDDDALITKNIGTNLLVTLFDTTKNCLNRLQDFETPVLVLSAKKDYIVNNKYHKKFIDGISSTNKEHILLANYYHAIFHEIDQHKILLPCRRFLERQFQDKKMQLPAVIPKARPHTVEEHKKLTEHGSIISRLYYAGFRLLFEKIGKLSGGVSTGLQYGFDSGISLDYIYSNKNSGTNYLGRVIDKVYLNSVGWKGIRTRKQNLKTALSGILALLNERGIEPVVLDIASGPGRYLFEIQSEMEFRISLLLNDNDSNSLEYAKKLAEDFKSQDVSFSEHDAFTLGTNTTNEQEPNVIIVSGLFELYDNNQQVHHVISQLYSMLSNGGYLLYTGQPWHPQMELIGRLLNNRNGKRWIMRRRIQCEMDLLVESAGFSKLNTEADDLGIFTVSCAQKKEP